MTIKDDPPIVHAQVINDDPEIDLTEPASATASMVGANGGSAPPAANPVFVRPASTTAPTTTTTTTIYTTTPPRPSGSGGGYGRNPCNTTCPNCHQQTRTRVSHRIDGVTVLAIVLLLLLFWPLFWLPLVIPACKSTEHYCRNCNYRLAKDDACS